MGKQGEKMCKYATDFILQEACSLPHVAVCPYTRHRVVTTTYKTYFVNYRGLSRSGGKKKKKRKKHTSHTPVQRFEMLPNVLHSWTYRTSGIKLLKQHRFGYGGYNAKFE